MQLVCDQQLAAAEKELDLKRNQQLVGVETSLAKLEAEKDAVELERERMRTQIDE